MSEDVLGTPGAQKRTIAIWVVVATIVLLIVGTIIAFAVVPGLADNGRGSPQAEASPTPTVTATPAPAASPRPTAELDDADASDVLETALAVPIATVGTDVDLAELLKNIAVGSYSKELEAQWQELISQGWTMSGTPTIVSSEVTALDTDSSPPTASVTACIDSSDVAMLDSAGAPIGDASAQMPRALHLFTLTQGDDGIWRISSHSFPNDPKC
ncbi:hypothetical protein [Streptomyces sp. AC495_CC817]|uniref:hypothetical protein n=1 Tax=Streptomyces sp. AC495_CC817 TaxID=2823900 RepID=UPI001C25F805|nr:hypothetical protein [Streptomyces sp. AC495_CC817]